MYTRSYGSRQNLSPRTLPPDYGGTALTISQPEPAPPPPPALPSPPREDPPERPPSLSHEPARRPRFSGRRHPIITSPSMPSKPDYDARRDTQKEPSPSSRRDPLGAPPFGGGADPYLGGGQPFTPTEADVASVGSEASLADSSDDGRLFSTLSLKQDDLLLLGLLLFLLHEQDEEDTDCRDALLLLAVLFVAGL